MSEFPPSVIEAFEIIGHERSEFWYMFEVRWGGFDLPALVRGLQEGEQEERLFALMAIGYGAYLSAIPTILPFLQSAYPLERWAAALALGMMDECTRQYPLSLEGVLRIRLFAYSCPLSRYFHEYAENVE